MRLKSSFINVSLYTRGLENGSEYSPSRLQQGNLSDLAQEVGMANEVYILASVITIIMLLTL